MKGKPGRPRKPLPGHESGHSTGTAKHETRVNGGDERGALVTGAVAPVAPRLFDLAASAAYLGISPWVIRDLQHAGILARVYVPGPPSQPGKPQRVDENLRKLLFDRVDLDRLVEVWKKK